jgi:hypothetical protein
MLGYSMWREWRVEMFVGERKWVVEGGGRREVDLGFSSPAKTFRKGTVSIGRSLGTLSRQQQQWIACRETAGEIADLSLGSDVKGLGSALELLPRLSMIAT